MRAGHAALLVAGMVSMAACSSGSASHGAAGPSPSGPGTSGTVSPSASATGRTPVTITLWSGFTDREFGILTKTVADFHASHPWITVKNVAGQDDDKIVKSIRAGNGPDVALSFTADKIGNYCGSGAWIDLGPYVQRDKVDLTQIPKPSLEYTQFAGKRCALPALADTYGLYYNTAMLAAAGYHDPPKTASQLLDMAVKLTTYNSDGSIKVAGFVPVWGFYEMAPAHVAPAWGATWTDSKGASNLAQDPHWAAMVAWQKKFVDTIGYSKLRKFISGAGSTEFAATNLFETGKLAMNIDGEYRTAFVHSEHPTLAFATAPFPVDDAQPELYGAGYVTGNSVGIPRTSKGDKREAAWELVKWLSTDPQAQISLATQLRNVPTLNAALADPGLTGDQQFAVFLKIYANPRSATTPPSAAGSADQDTLSAFLDKYQGGSATDLAKGLADSDRQIDALVRQAGNGGAP